MNIGATITIPMPPQNERTLAFLAQFPHAALRAIGRGQTLATQEVLSRTIADRLVTKGPNAYRAKGRIGGSWPVSNHRLGPLTHDLSTTMLAVPASIEGNTVRTSIGSPVEYWFAHEFGVNQLVPRTRKVKWRRGSTRSRQVSASDYSSSFRRIIPARAPVQTGIAENLSVFETRINEALSMEWRSGL